MLTDGNESFIRFLSNEFPLANRFILNDIGYVEGFAFSAIMLIQNVNEICDG